MESAKEIYRQKIISGKGGKRGVKAPLFAIKKRQTLLEASLFVSLPGHKQKEAQQTNVPLNRIRLMSIPFTLFNFV